MINQQLIDYIKKESQRGVLMESTKNALLAIGWTEKDIKKAYDSLSTPVPVSKFNKKFIWIFVVLLLIITGGVFAFVYYPSLVNTKNFLTTDTLPPTPETLPPPVVETSPLVPAPVISDTDKVTAIMDELCRGYLANDISMISKHASSQSLSPVSEAKLNPIASCAVNKVYQSGINIIANATITSTEKNPTELLPVSDTIFINENGDWKFDLTASLNFATEQNKIKILAGDPNGFVDLAVVGITTSPTRAIINKKDLKIIITVKNLGTKTSEAGAPLVVSLEGFKDSTSLNGGNYEPLLAGETTEWIFYPYKYNNLLKISDTAGQKTIRIELNPNNKIIESNYDNNIFTQNIQIYAK